MVEPHKSPDLLAPWWTWNPDTAALGDYAYRWFNLFEAGVWFVFAILVARRWLNQQRSMLEPVYATAFVVFGLTDVAEAWQQSLPLLTLKGVVLATLLILRHRVRQRWYPANRLY